MKTFCLITILLCIGTMLKAQVSRTVELTPGSLIERLTAEELNTVTHLAITGMMDARDFKTIHDTMPALSELDLEEVIIVAFTDTTQLQDVYYPANTVPESEPEFGHEYTTSYGLANLPGLTRVTLPSSLTAIGYRAFNACRGLLSVGMPVSLTNIGGGAFMDCTSLVEIDIPSAVSFVGKEAFMGCSYLSQVNLPPALPVIKSKTFEACTSLTDIQLPASVTTIEFRAFYGCTQLKSPVFPPALKKIGGGAFENCSALTEIVLPGAVTTIESQAFSNCPGLIAVTLPPSVTSIGHWSFAECSSLSAIYSYPVQPVNLDNVQEVFTSTDQNTCILYVPKGSATSYGSAAQWKDFSQVEEMPLLALSATMIDFNADESTVKVQLTTEGPWTAAPDQEWLTVEPSSGTGSQTLTLSATDNASVISRMAKVTITTTAPFSQDIMVKQQGMVKAVALTAGRLAELLTSEELSGITSLTLTGSMDARDFKVIRDRMPLLEKLDISQATVAAYSGGDGTISKFVDYPANAIPSLALASWPQYPGKYHLAEITLPGSITLIGDYAFAGCMTLKELSLPSQVTAIGKGAFADCSGLTTFIVPSAVTTVGADAFRNCTGLTTMTLSPLLTEIAESLFINCSGLVSIYIPDYVTSIGQQAFYGCSSLSVISMPHLIRSIGSYAFLGCSSLKEVMIPEGLTSLGTSAYAYCTALKAVYAYPRQPVDLINSPDVFLGVDKANCTLLVPQNTRSLYEVADQWKDFLHIMDMPLGTEDLLNPAFEMNYYPNPFTQQLSIEIVNPLLKETTVDIYSISGQKIKTLAKALKGQKISLMWRGDDEQGRQVPGGMYLLKMNGQTWKVLKGL